MPDAPTNGPTPANMPGATTSAPGGTETTEDPNLGDDPDDEGGDEPSYEELQAEAKKWRDLSQKNEKRAKANADKAKQFDQQAPEWRAAWDREQAAKNAQKSPEQIKADADAEAAAKVAAAEARAAEAEAKSLRRDIADGRVPTWAMGLVNGTDEDTITEQVEDLVKNLEEWYAAKLAADTNPRKPQPNPLAGRGTGTGTTPQEAFAATFGPLLNPVR